MVKDLILYHGTVKPEPGFPLRREYTPRHVLGRVDGAYASEFATAGSHGIKPEKRAKVFQGDYQGETLVELDSTLYSVYRTYPVGRRIELYLSAWVEPAELQSVVLIAAIGARGVFETGEDSRREVQAAVKTFRLAASFEGQTHDPEENAVFWLPDAAQYHGELSVEWAGMVYTVTEAAYLGMAVQLTARRRRA